MKLVHSIILASALSALSFSTFAMEDNEKASETDPFYRAAAGKMNMAKNKHGEMKEHNASEGAMHEVSKRYGHPVFVPGSALTPLHDNR